MVEQDLQKELELIQNLFGAINALKDTHPDWYFYFEDLDPDLASRRELIDLIESAPNEAARFYIFGKLTMRMQLARLFGADKDMLLIANAVDAK